jgi:hypothetical protein
MYSHNCGPVNSTIFFAKLAKKKLSHSFFLTHSYTTCLLSPSLARLVLAAETRSYWRFGRK